MIRRYLGCGEARLGVKNEVLECQTETAMVSLVYGEL